MTKKIILTGYMGVGKSTIGKCLAKKIFFPFVDLDRLIEEKNNATIPEIFQSKGEIFFRKQEHIILNELIDNEQNMIISLGGGTPCYANNHLVLQRENITSIYLKMNAHDLTERLKQSKKNRPLLQNIDDLYSFVGQHLFERNYFYSFAKHTINVANKSVEKIVEEIIPLASR